MANHSGCKSGVMKLLKLQSNLSGRYLGGDQFRFIIVSISQASACCNRLLYVLFHNIFPTVIDGALGIATGPLVRFFSPFLINLLYIGHTDVKANTR